MPHDGKIIADMPHDGIMEGYMSHDCGKIIADRCYMIAKVLQTDAT